MRLGRIGFDRVVGYLQDGLRSLDSRPEIIARTERLSPTVAAERLASDEPPLVVDVRAPREYETKHIDGSISMPLNHLEQLADGLPTDRPLLVHCAGGYRSSIAVSLLRRMGFNHVTELAGGIAAWEAAGFSVSRLAA
jgi:rhodanese-related sulfurtransferase